MSAKQPQLKNRKSDDECKREKFWSDYEGGGGCRTMSAPKSLLKRADAQFKTNISKESRSMKISAAHTRTCELKFGGKTLAIKCDGTLAFPKLTQDTSAK